MNSTAELRAALAEVRREIALRERVYPKWINGGTLSKANADQQLQRMRWAAECISAHVYLAEASEEMLKKP